MQVQLINIFLLITIEYESNRTKFKKLNFLFSTFWASSRGVKYRRKEFCRFINYDFCLCCNPFLIFLLIDKGNYTSILARFGTYNSFNRPSKCQYWHNQANKAESPEKNPCLCPCSYFLLDKVHFHRKIYSQRPEVQSPQNC